AELEQGHSVFVDFTAAWCLTCKFNEANVLESSAVRQAFQRHAIVKLKADWTNGDPVITKLLQQFGRPGVPLYVLYPGKSEEPIRIFRPLTQMANPIRFRNTKAKLSCSNGLIRNARS